jgi:dienelactone hydrolase
MSMSCTDAASPPGTGAVGADGSSADGGAGDSPGGTGGSPGETGDSVVTDAGQDASSVDCAAFVVTGQVTAPGGARFAYRSTDDGEMYNLEGIVFVPAGDGPFPAVVVSHGAGGLPANYSANVARTMVGWGMVVIGVRYTHAADPDGRNALLLPAGDNGASAANVSRARKTHALLGCVGNIDPTRVAAHGHSMGAFVTGEVVGTFPGLFRAASHTAGGTSSGPNATRPATAEKIRTPYQLHHGDADRVVNIRQDETLDEILTANGVVHELLRYPGYTHEQIALDAAMLERTRVWYQQHGVLR